VAGFSLLRPGRRLLRWLHLPGQLVIPGAVLLATVVAAGVSAPWWLVLAGAALGLYLLLALYAFICFRLIRIAMLSRDMLGTLIATLMGVGAVFGALNTMYNAVSTRLREIATLRALGFGSGPVVGSVLLESLAPALVGGPIGCFIAYFAFNGYRAATINFQSFSQVAFAFAVTPGLLLRGILYAMVIGLIGGIFPAFRAARLPVASALRGL